MRSTLFVALSILIFAVSCKKSELKKPSALEVKFGINTDQSQNNDILFQSAEITLQTFTLTGKRSEGPEVNLVRSLSAPLTIDIKGNSNLPIDELKLDVPQGEYTELAIQFDNVFSTYKGKYKLSNGPTVDVIFEIPDYYVFTIICESEDQIKLDKKVTKNINVNLNCVKWFEPITNNQLENAEIITENNGIGLGNSTILINASHNLNLYNVILPHILEGNSALIK